MHMPELSRIERPSIRVTRTLLPAVERRMAELFDASFNPDDTPLTREALIAAMADCDVLVPTVTDSIDAVVIAAAPPDVVQPADDAGEEVADRAHARCIWDGVVVWMRHVEAEGACLHPSISAAITRVLRFLAD